MAIKYVGESGVKELASLSKQETEAAITRKTASDEEIQAMLDEVFGNG